MSTTTVKAYVPPPKDLYTHSLYCEYELPKILNAMKEKAISMVPEASKNEKWTNLGSRFTAKKVINAVYQEFAQMTRERFAYPKFDFVIEETIRQKHYYFYHTVLNIVKDALQELGVKEGYTIPEGYQ
jgi:hypothetical protein